MNKILLTLALATIIRGTFAAPNHPWHYAKRFLDGGEAIELTSWKLVDIGWRPRVAPGARWQGDFVPFNEHFEKWIIVTTNAVTRPMSVPASSRYYDTVTNLTTEVDTLTATNAVLAPEAAKAWKVEKAREKAAKKDAKNLKKLIDDTIKARKKSSEAMAELYDGVLELLTNRVDEATD